VEKEVEEYKMVDIKTSGVLSVIDFAGTHNTIVNAIRRTILDDVPTMAIEDVEVVVNTSPIYDEIVAHRLGLVPLTTDFKSYNFKNDCKCGGIGCALCEVKMSLAAETPGYVLAESIKSDDPKVIPADLKLPITKLFGEKKIELNMKAVLGTGREHAKWAPAHTYLRENKKGVELVIEPFGQLSAKEVYNKAIDVLVEKIADLEASF